MNDSETVALIGGGHAVGRAHGACPGGPGPAPREDPLQSWPGQCGRGRGEDTYTSGYEMPFTSRPTTFDTEYFHNLLEFQWRLVRGSGDKNQWEPVRGARGKSEVPRAPRAHGPPGQETVGMLTTDLALCADPDYNEIVQLFARVNIRDQYLVVRSEMLLLSGRGEVPRDVRPRLVQVDDERYGPQDQV